MLILLVITIIHNYYNLVLLIKNINKAYGTVQAPIIRVSTSDHAFVGEFHRVHPSHRRTILHDENLAKESLTTQLLPHKEISY